MPNDQSEAVSKLLAHWVQGDQKALTALLPLVYNELRRAAHYQLQRERPDHTLQSTALVHEAYLRLLGNTAPEIRGRSHFVAIAARLIRQILVDYAREHLDAVPVLADADLLALDEAMNDLYRTDERQAQIVDMKFFGGLSAPEVADVLGLSRATVDRDWATARAWLYRQIKRTASS
jgi:RNA polymerase sigma factor (TIGR02999 family)